MIKLTIEIQIDNIKQIICDIKDLYYKLLLKVLPNKNMRHFHIMVKRSKYMHKRLDELDVIIKKIEKYRKSDKPSQ